MVHPGGKPTELTPQVLQDVRRLLLTCRYLETVADYIGDTRPTIRNWLRRGAKKAKRLLRNRQAVDVTEARGAPSGVAGDESLPAR
jgi:hypothetical protein